MPRNVWNDVVSWQTRRLNNSTKLSTPCIDDHHIKEEEELKSVGELSKVSSQTVLKCLYLARIGRLDISLVSEQICIHHTCEHKQYCHVGNTAKTMQGGTV